MTLDTAQKICNLYNQSVPELLTTSVAAKVPRDIPHRHYQSLLKQLRLLLQNKNWPASFVKIATQVVDVQQKILSVINARKKGILERFVSQHRLQSQMQVIITIIFL